MESHELLRSVFDKKRPKEVSADLALSTSMVYKWAQPRAADGSGIEHLHGLYRPDRFVFHIDIARSVPARRRR